MGKKKGTIKHRMRLMLVLIFFVLGVVDFVALCIIFTYIEVAFISGFFILPIIAVLILLYLYDIEIKSTAGITYVLIAIVGHIVAYSAFYVSFL